MMNRIPRSLSGAGCMVFFIAVALLASAGIVQADEKTERDRRVRIALALADAESQAAKAKLAAGKGGVSLAEAAPMPRQASLVPYGRGYEQSTEDNIPLVVYVGCDGIKIDGAATVKVESFPDVKSPAVVVGYPVGGRLMPDKVFTGKPTDAELQKAADNAKRKMDQKQMPSGTGKPLPPPCSSYMISAEAGPCVCEKNCQCEKNGKTCPKECPLTYAQACEKVAKGETVFLSVGKRVPKVVVCNGKFCELKEVTGHTDSLKGFEAGVWKCWLEGGKPVMVLVQR